MKLSIPRVTPVSIPMVDPERKYMREWKSFKDPPLQWYNAFSSMQYHVHRIDTDVFFLTPVVGRPVYTFEQIGDFIDASREFTVRLFTDKFIDGVPQYRVHPGPPRNHSLYRLPPRWTWDESETVLLDKC